MVMQLFIRKKRWNNMITFNANNNKQLTVSQSVHDGDVTVTRGNVMETITAGDFVMLLNLYSYIVDNDIQNDFINPYGKNEKAL